MSQAAEDGHGKGTVPKGVSCLKFLLLGHGVKNDMTVISVMGRYRMYTIVYRETAPTVFFFYAQMHSYINKGGLSCHYLKVPVWLSSHP